MIFNSDWHIHSLNSYDATLPLSKIYEEAKKLGMKKIGITDHANYNDEKFLSDLDSSASDVIEFQKNHPDMILGVELTPIEKPEFDYIEKYKTREGYIQPATDKPYEIELAQTKEQLMKRGVRYAIGASHWRVDTPFTEDRPSDKYTVMKEGYRQQLWLAQDERVTILGHPWYNGKGLWYDDFSAIPHSMNMDIAHALKENHKYVECNSGFLLSEKTTEKFRAQYAEFMRELFEMGIPVTFGSDSHHQYEPKIDELEKLLRKVGFKDGDFSELKEEDLWF